MKMAIEVAFISLLNLDDVRSDDGTKSSQDAWPSNRPFSKAITMIYLFYLCDEDFIPYAFHTLFFLFQLEDVITIHEILWGGSRGWRIFPHNTNQSTQTLQDCLMFHGMMLA